MTLLDGLSLEAPSVCSSSLHVIFPAWFSAVELHLTQSKAFDNFGFWNSLWLSMYTPPTTSGTANSCMESGVQSTLKTSTKRAIFISFNQLVHGDHFVTIPPRVLARAIFFFPIIDRSWIWPSPNEIHSQQIAHLMLTRYLGSFTIHPAFLKMLAIKDKQGMVVWKGESPWDDLNNILLETTDTTAPKGMKKRAHLNPIETNLKYWTQLINSRPSPSKKQLTPGPSPSRPSCVYTCFFCVACRTPHALKPFVVTSMNWALPCLPFWPFPGTVGRTHAGSLRAPLTILSGDAPLTQKRKTVPTHGSPHWNFMIHVRRCALQSTPLCWRTPALLCV